MRIRLVLLVFGVFALLNVHAQSLQDGIALLHGEKLKEAGEIFKNLAADGTNADNQYYLGYFYTKNNQFDEAKKAFDKGLEIDSKSYINKVGLGTLELQKGNKAAAKELFDEAEKKKKKDAEVLFRIGEAYTLFEKNNDPAEAIRLLDEAIKRDNTLADAYLAKGDALMLKNEGGPAATAYEYALGVKPNYAVAHNRIGQIYLRGKNYNLALENYKKAIDSDPNFAPAYKDLAELYFLGKQYKRAAENYDLYLEKSATTDPEMQLRATKFTFVADDYDRTIKLLDGLKGKSADPMIDRMYGWSYLKINEPEKSIDYINKFIAEAPDKVIGDDYKYMGQAYNLTNTDGKGYDSLGMQYILKGADMDTSATDAAATYKEVAALYYGAKDYEKAAPVFKKGIQLDTLKASPNDLFSLGLSYFQWSTSLVAAGSPDSAAIAQKKKSLYLSADSSFAAVAVKTPDWPYAYYWRASSLYNAYDRQENVDKGISAPYYEKLAELAEKDEDPSKYNSYLKFAYQYLGIYYQSTMNNPDKAKVIWEKLLKIDPDNANAKEGLGLNQPQAEASANK